MLQTDYMIEMAIFNVQGAITPKVGKSKLRFVCSARHLIVLYISVKFCENNSNGIRVMQRTLNYCKNGCSMFKGQ